MGLANISCSRRVFLAAVPSLCAAATGGKGAVFPSAVFRYADATTEFPVFRLTNPEHTSILPPHYARAVARKSNFLIYASDVSGSIQAYRMDLKNGQSRLLTEADNFNPSCFTLAPDERSFLYADGSGLVSSSLSSLRSRLVYQPAEGFRVSEFSLTEDGLAALLVEKQDSRCRLQMIRMADGIATTLAETTADNDEIGDPSPRPRRASVLYRRAGGVWLANFDGKQNYRLKLSEGQAISAAWSPDGRTVLYLNVPADPHKLRNIREFTPDTNEDKAVSPTTQYACFERNADASVFVGASGSKASPHVLLLVRAVQREFTLCEHRASDPSRVAPVFSPNSQNVFFSSDQHGKPAIYRIAVDRLVETTDEPPAANERK